MSSTLYPTTITQQLHSLHAALHLSHTPCDMPCRGKQQAEIRTFMKHHVDAHKGGSLYLSGSPGTGKTASVDHVIYELYGRRILEGIHATPASSSTTSSARKTSSKLLSRFNASTTPAATSANAPRIVYSNAMTFSRSPKSLYPKLLAQLKGLTIDEEAALAPMDALEQLKLIFCPGESTVASSKKKSLSTDGPMTLVVLDEVDALLSGASPAVLYSLLEWPLTIGSKLVVIAISNSINLLEQKLPHLVARNAVPTSLVFSTYSKEELKQIVQDRCDSIYPPVMQIKKVATKSGLPPKSPAKSKTPMKSPAASSVKKAPSVSTSPAASPTKTPLRGKSNGSVVSSPVLITAPAFERRISRSAAAAAQSSPPSAKKLISAPSTPVITQSSSIAQLSTSRSRKRKLEVAKDEVEEIDPEDAMRDVDEPSVDQVTPEPEVEEVLITPVKKKPKLSIDTPVSSSSAITPEQSPSGSMDGRCHDAMLAPLSTRETPFFDPFAIELLCAKVAKGSGDLRKVLEVARKAVDALMVELEGRRLLAKERMLTTLTYTPSTTPAASPNGTAFPSYLRPNTPREDRSDGAPSPFEDANSAEHAHSPLQVSVGLLHSLMLGSLGSSNDQTSLLRSLPAQQKVILVIAGLLGHMQGSKDVLAGFAKHHARFAKHFDLPTLTGHELADLLAALAAHRLIKLLPPSRKRGPTGGSGAGSGSGAKRKGGSGGGNSGPAAGSPFGTIQVNVTLETLNGAFEEEPAIERLLTKGKAIAATIIAATNAKAAAANSQSDQQMQDVE